MHGARVECVEDAQVGAGGASPISLEDFATAMVDEPERPRHPHQRFPIGYRTIGDSRELLLEFAQLRADAAPNQPHAGGDEGKQRE
jgi:hypothetical protein